MSEHRMRFRTDSRYIADAKAQRRPYHDCYGSRAEWDATEPARPGDVWRVTWYGSNAVAGYDIACPCGRVHGWTSARNCASRTPDGRCAHTGVGSCWTWTGSAEAGTLSAAPSLAIITSDDMPCTFHGFLTNGVLRG